MQHTVIQNHALQLRLVCDDLRASWVNTQTCAGSRRSCRGTCRGMRIKSVDKWICRYGICSYAPPPSNKFEVGQGVTLPGSDWALAEKNVIYGFSLKREVIFLMYDNTLQRGHKSKWPSTQSPGSGIRIQAKCQILVPPLAQPGPLKGSPTASPPHVSIPSLPHPLKTCALAL